MKKILSVFLTLTLIIGIMLGFNFPAYASGFSTAKNIRLNTYYNTSLDGTEEYSLMDAGYNEYYRFTVPAKGWITLNIKSRQTDYFPTFRLYRSNNTSDSIKFLFRDNVKNADYSYSYGGYYCNWNVQLNPGTYYLVLEYFSNQFYTPYSFTVNYKPSFYNTKITSRTGLANGFKVNWSKATYASGYQIQYSVHSNMSGAKSVYVSGASSVTRTIKNCSSKKRYYIRIRSYKKVKVNGAYKNFFGKWSAKTSVVTK